MLDQKNKAIHAKVRINKTVIRIFVVSRLSVGITLTHFSVAKTVLKIISPKTLNLRL